MSLKLISDKAMMCWNNYPVSTRQINTKCHAYLEYNASVQRTARALISSLDDGDSMYVLPGSDDSSVGPESNPIGLDSSSVGPDSSSVGPYSSSVGPDSSSVGTDSSSVGGCI